MISSLTRGTSFVDILYIHAGTCTMVSAIKAVEPRQNAVRSALPRSVHVAEVVSLALALESAPASPHLDATIEDYHSCLRQSISSQTYCHRVCLITRVLELDILFTRANVKIILAGVISTSDVKTRCRACSVKTWSLTIMRNSIFDSSSSSSSR